MQHHLHYSGLPVQHKYDAGMSDAGTILPFRKEDRFRLTWWTNWWNFWGGILFCVGWVPYPLMLLQQLHLDLKENQSIHK